MIQDKLRQLVYKAFVQEFGVFPEKATFDRPDDEKWGDFATNACMISAKELKQNPLNIAKQIDYRITELVKNKSNESDEYMFLASHVIASPGFINFKIKTSWLQNELKKAIKENDNYGSSIIGKGKTVLVEYSQPNTNKPMHIGHARNNFLGSSISNILSFLSYKVIRSNYVGDIGIHICKSMLMYMKHGGNKVPNKKSDHFVGDFYIMFEKEAERNPDLIKEAQELLVRWEKGDKEIIDLWNKMNTWVYEGWKTTYAEENVTFDIWEYESACLNVGKEIADYAVKTGLASKDKTGAIIAKLEQFNLPDKVLLRADGTSVYSTKDLQLAKDSFEKYKFDKRLYIVDFRQSDYFKQVFKVLELLGFDWASRLYHLSYGVVSLPSGMMSSRTGSVVNADEVLHSLYEMEKLETEKRAYSNSGVAENEFSYREVALAAFRYALLKVDYRQNIVFDYDTVLKTEGDTGPYIQYTHARAQSVLRKASQLDLDNLSDLVSAPINQSYRSETGTLSEDLKESELTLMKFILRFPELVLKAGEEFAPNHICNYLFELCSRFNHFYNDLAILSEEALEKRVFRLLITKAFAQTVKNGLNLLCITAPDRM